MDPEPQAATLSEASLIQSFLASRDEPCPGCNYNLRGLTANRCPECGWTPELSLVRNRSAPPRFVARVALSSVVLSIGSVIWTIVSITAIESSGLPRGLFVLMYVTHAVIAASGLSALVISAIAWKRRGRESGRRMMVTCALCYWLLEVLLQLVFAVGNVFGWW